MEASGDEKLSKKTTKSLEDFVKSYNMEIDSLYVENQLSDKLDRPELLKLINECKFYDVILVEDINILSRLTNKCWKKLQHAAQSKNVRVVAINIPATYPILKSYAEINNNDVLSISNNILIEVLGAINSEYNSRYSNKSKAKKKSTGRKPDLKLYAAINKLSDDGYTYEEISKELNCSSTTISRAKKWNAENQISKKKRAVI